MRRPCPLTPRLRPLTPRHPLAIAVALASVLAACGHAYRPEAQTPTPGRLVLRHSVDAQPASASPWPAYHNTPNHDGVSPGTPPVSTLHRAWQTKLGGAVYAAPVVVDGRVIVADEHDSVYALAPRTGRILWRTRLGTPVPASALPCGDINPLGITGTPVYDPATGLVYVVAEVTGYHHVLYGLNPANGAVDVRVDADPPDNDPAALQQRGALAVDAGRVYVPYGGLAGNCGAYRGAVVGVPATGAGPEISFTVPTTRQGGISSANGVEISGGWLYVAVGNGAATAASGPYDDSDSVLRLSAGLVLESLFAPATWAADNSGGLDLGSSGVALLADGRAVVDGTGGVAYLLATPDLGGIGHPLATLSGCTAFGGTAVWGDVAYEACTQGLEAMRAGPGRTLTRLWQAPAGVDGPAVLGGGAVFSLQLATGRLVALSRATGAVLGSVAVGPLPHFATPALDGPWAFIPTLHGVTGVSGL